MLDSSHMIVHCWLQLQSKGNSILFKTCICDNKSFHFKVVVQYYSKWTKRAAVKIICVFVEVFSLYLNHVRQRYLGLMVLVGCWLLIWMGILYNFAGKKYSSFAQAFIFFVSWLILWSETSDTNRNMCKMKHDLNFYWEPCSHYHTFTQNN